MIKRDVITSVFDKDGHPHRPIRSFVLRQGRLTKGQAAALEQLWPILGLEYSQDKIVDFNQLYQRNADVTLEIGFGMGASLVTMAANNRESNYLGIEVHQPGVGACLIAAQEQDISNLRVMCHDAVEVLEHMIPDNSLQMVQLFFPDPWHKARHNKRRIVQAPFAELLRHKLKIDGIFHMATDWQEYAEHMLMVMDGLPDYQNLSITGDYVPRPDSRPITKFEARGQRLGHGVWDLQFKRIR